MSDGIDNPEVAALIAMSAQSSAPKVRDLPPDEGRQVFLAMTAMLDTEPNPDCQTRDMSFDGPAGPIPCRLYGTAAKTDALIVYFHGGGFVIGNLDSHDAFCRDLALETGARVLAVDYRLAPETPYPGAHDDCLAVVDAVRARPEMFTPAVTGVALAGDSAGGNLAAVVSIDERTAHADGKVPVIAQWLIYPATDMQAQSASYELHGSGKMLELEDMEFFSNAYLPKGTDKSGASPMQSERIRHAPSTLLVTSGLDPLRDEGRAYAARLIQEGVPVIFREWADMPHGIINMRKAVPSAQEPIRQAMREFGALLN